MVYEQMFKISGHSQTYKSITTEMDMTKNKKI